MIRILTDKDCIVVNLPSFDREIKCCGVLQYHVKNKTGKKLKINAWGESVLIDTSVVDEVAFEPRACEARVLEAIGELIVESKGNTNKGEADAAKNEA